MADGCKEKDCTVTQTGICLLNNPPTTCPQRVVSDPPTHIGQELSPLPAPRQNPSFPGTLAMSLADASALMARRYCRLIGILGLPEAGKTALLVCVYLLLASRKLVGFEFRNSATLMALEEISRGARRWKRGDPPGNLTQHTEAKDERAAGLLHFRLAVEQSGEVVDLLFPDLPGEWSTSLIDFNRSDRLDFFRSTEAIWIVVDGLELTDLRKRQTAIHRCTVLFQRVRALFVNAAVPPLCLVISRRDQAQLAPHHYGALVDEAAKLGINLTALQIASFSENDAIAPGSGIPELLATATHSLDRRTETWPISSDVDSGRQMLMYRKR
jgi:hypothetical protein